MIYSIGQSMKRVDVPMNAAKNNLPIGTVCKLEGYGNPESVIVANAGINESFPDYGARYTLVNREDYSSKISDAVSMTHLSEKKDGRIHQYYTSEVVEADEVLDLIEKAKNAAGFRERAKNEKAEHKAALIAGLPAKYPHLKVNDGVKSSHALGASNIKLELKRAFPLIKFEVKSSSYSGGCSIDVRWTDGVTTESVDTIIKKYQQGSFDGMTDSYTYDPDRYWSIVFGGARHVFSQRHCTAEAYNKTAVELGYPEAVFNEKTGQFDGVTYDINETIKRETWKRAF